MLVSKLNSTLWIGLICLLSTTTQPLAQLTLKKSTINNGGTTMTGDSYKINATINQADAGLSQTNGNFVLTGGFWQQNMNTNYDLIFKNSFDQ